MTTTFNSKEIVQNFLEGLPKRSQDILTKRYGLGNSVKRHTLESIGQKYKITRERVRQIENHSIKNIIKSDDFSKAEKYFNELVNIIESIGGLAEEKSLLEYLSKDVSEQNYLHFLFVIGNPFYKDKRDNDFDAKWYTDKKVAENVIKVLKRVHSQFEEDQLFTEVQLIDLVRKEANKLKNRKELNDDQIKNWLTASRVIGRNPFNEWGLATSQNIKIRGIRSYAYLVVRQNGSPMHFKEVAKMINKHFKKNVHTATCHNELIKDERFVLVGRGMYALTEWGYTKGIVKDVILDILKKEGKLTKESVIDRVLKERYVKENTVIVNLQNSDYFKKHKDGTYSLI
ncbi:MAG: hypothetical protein KAJ58_01205 [Candidatus Pacebacteria bacterium]|nr:hypothetical protein [Candidatus Paceibacterota bacterium]